ncbi:hypothetical protein EPN90_00660 [Patescibacteria group bacterium]|nr:MAG: hypothetical protein EPN90_00660 [Patescibacteria group bacterium]
MDSQEQKTTVKTRGFWTALSMAWELGYVIALPIVFLALGGRLLDKRFGSSPFFLLAGVVLAVAITSVWVVKKAKKMLAEISDVEHPADVQRPDIL